MIRLWVPPDRLVPGPLRLDGDDHHYLARVRRLRPGDAVTLFDGAGREADAAVTAVDDDALTVDVAAPRELALRPRPAVTVLLSLIKGDRTEWAVQKLVELGVDRIVPVQAARCVVKLGANRAADRVARYRAVARAAAQQCRRSTLPDIEPVVPLSAALAAVPDDALRLVLYEREREASLADALPASPPGAIALLIGPEGGFAPDEVDSAVSAGFRPVALGPRVLRAETAAVAAAAVLGYVFGDLGTV